MDPVFKERVWGGYKLKTEFDYNVGSYSVGECWGIAAHPNGCSVVRDGEFKGLSLRDLWENHRELFGNIEGKTFPLLIKILDAKEDLSIQVHPDDEYANINEGGSFGKTECWYVLQADKNASLIIGHNAKDKEELVSMVEEKKWNELLHRVPVKKGDFVQINPGTLHAIKGGVMILETQQNSDITYRFYDYDRLFLGKKRELQLDKALSVTSFNDKIFYKANSKTIDDLLLDTSDAKENNLYEMFSCPYYSISKMIVNNTAKLVNKSPFLLVSVVEGDGYANDKKIKKGDHFIVPFELKEVSLSGDMEIVITSV